MPDKLVVNQKIALLQKYPEGFYIPLIIHYNHHYRAGNNNKALTIWMLEDYFKTGNGANRAIINTIINELLQ